MSVVNADAADVDHDGASILSESVPLLPSKRQSAQPQPSASFLGTVLTLSNSAIGAGVLAIPFAVSAGGIGMALLLFALVTMTTWFSLHLFAQAILEVRRRGLPSSGYEDIAFAAGGRTLGLLAKAQLVFSLVGAMIAFLILLRQMTWNLTARWIADDERTIWTSHGMLTSYVVAFVILPISLLPSLSAFRFASVLALGTIGYISGSVVVYSASSEAPGSRNGALHWFRWTTDICFALPTLIFAFGCHSCLPQLVGEIRGASLRKFDAVAGSAMGLCVLFYGSVGIAGYAAFRSATDGNILANFPIDNVVVGVFGRAAMASAISLTFPLLMWPARYAVDTALFPARAFSWTRHTVITIVVLGFALAVALLYPNVTVVFSLSGSSGAVCNQFIFPGTFYLRLVAKSPRERLPAIAMIAYGVVVGVVCSTVILYRIIHGN